jgi:hypothetical protein
MNRHQRSVTIEQASLQSPVLARLTQQGQESVRRFEAIKFLLPEAIRQAVKPGSIDNSVWCLLAENAAVAAKLRQLLPSILDQLSAQGTEITAIRVRVVSLS